MARIIGGIGASHTPTIGFAQDQKKFDDPVWKPIFDCFAPVKVWLTEQAIDVAFVIYNDHITSFFFDHYSAFALGVDSEYASADEGGGPRNIAPIKGHPELARHIGFSLTADGFDLSYFQRKPLDHGCFSPLSLMFDHTPNWPIPIVPLQVGILQAPAPSAARCYALGKALRRAIESYPPDLRVAIIGTGGLSHQVHGERAGFNNPQWDAEFLQLIEKDPEQLSRMTMAQLAKLGGYESAEVVMWLIMRGALSAHVKKVHQAYYLPSMTGIASVIFENSATLPNAQAISEHRTHMQHDIHGLEQLEGTHPFTLETAHRAYRLNAFLHSLIQPQARNAYKLNPFASYQASQLTEKEIELLESRNWQALIHYGVIFFLLEKFAVILGLNNIDIYAGMRGQTVADFAATRNVPNARYSVTGAQ